MLPADHAIETSNTMIDELLQFVIVSVEQPLFVTICYGHEIYDFPDSCFNKNNHYQLKLLLVMV